MAQPPPYERQYAFRAFQTANPDDPLPGQKVDIEFNAVKATLDEVLANLALIQRDDGRVANNSVGTSQLDGALISLGFERPTAWATATAYAVDDAVFQNSKLYLCLVAHTSGTFNTDLSALKWEMVIDFTTIVTDAETARDAADGYAAAAQAAQAASEAIAEAVAASSNTWCGDSSGTNNYTVAPNSYFPAVRADGQKVRFRVKTANTGAVNLTVTGYADADVRRTGEEELESGAWPLNSIQEVSWNATKGWYTWTGDASITKFARLDVANTLAAALTLSSTLNVSGQTSVAALAASGVITVTGEISPTSLSADQNDYSPSGLSGASVVRQAASSAVTINGLAGGAAGREITWVNISAVAQTFGNERAGSTAANRFSLGVDLVLYPSESAVFRYDSTLARWVAKSPVRAPAVRGSGRGIRTFNNASTPDSKMDVTADELVLKTTTGAPALASAVSVTIDIAVSGAGGLDTGAEANSTWYYLWIIRQTATGTIAGLLSTSATSPTMPTGYSHMALVGAVYNDGSGNFRTTQSFESKVYQADVEVLNGAGVTSWTSLSIATAAPAIAIHAYGRSSIETNNLVGIRVASDSSGVIGVREAVANAGSTTVVDSQYGGSNFDLPLVTAQTIWRKHNATTAGQIIIINGFDLPTGA